MTFGISALACVTFLLIIDLVVLVVRFKIVQSLREKRRLEYQAEIREHEAKIWETQREMRESRAEIVASIERTRDLFQQYKALDE